MGLLELIILVLVLAWLFGAFVVPVGGSLIHLLIVVIIIVVIIIVVLVRILRGERL